MMDTVIFLHAGGGIGLVMGGIGALKFFLSASDSVARLPRALERGADALEKQAAAAEQSANVGQSLFELREGQEETRILTSSLIRRQDESAQVLAEIQKRLVAPPDGRRAQVGVECP